MTTKIIGKWKCIECKPNAKDLSNWESFTLDFKENYVFCLPKGNQLWPEKSEYESIGSKEGGYYFREDGCFFQLKNLKQNTVEIELNLKVTEEKTIVKYHFTMEKEKE